MKYDFKNDNRIPLIVVAGPTASGKTGLAIEIAKRYDTEVISADSMQIYKLMNIGTAKPTNDELQGIKHHMLDCVEPDSSFSVADYVKEARSIIKDIYSRGKIPVVAGGTGLYISSLVNNIQFNEIQGNKDLRQELYDYADLNGSEALHNMLKEIDPETALAVHMNNIPRVVRAIEVYRLTGVKMSIHQVNSRSLPSEYNCIKIGLSFKDRAKLYDRINKRVDIMISEGLVDEARVVLNSGFKSTAMQAIGYKELKAFIDGSISLDEATDNLKRETRRYAKRQLTWFRRDDEISWFNHDEYVNIQLLQKKIYNNIEIFFNMCYD